MILDIIVGKTFDSLHLKYLRSAEEIINLQS